jgi:hypothetical protein
MSMIALVADQAAVGKILDHLGLGAPEAEKPPPPPREVVRVAEHGTAGECRETGSRPRIPTQGAAGPSPGA